MKKNLFVLIFLSTFILSGFAQITLNPSHDFYKSVISWQNRGLITTIPPTRPYSASNIKEILTIILESDSEIDKQQAQIYWEEITGKPWNIAIISDSNYKNQNSESSFLENVTPELNGNISLFHDMVNMGYQAGFSIRNAYFIQNYLPLYSNFYCDARFDPANVGDLGIYLNINDIVSFRKNGFIIQAGIYRNGYGDIIGEGLALNDDSFHKPTFSLTYLNKWLSYTQQLNIVGATLNGFSNPYPKDSKLLAFHALEVKPFRWLSASFYETSMFGKRFDFSYLLPVPFMAAQSFSGYADSLMMGIRFKLTPIKKFALLTDVFVDDLDVNQLVKLNWNSKNRITWNTCLEYTPLPKFIERMAINFLMVTPYTYTHWDFDNNATEEVSSTTINYQNYTNCGYTIGTTLPPNSQQIKISFDFNPVKNLKINLYGSYTEHANITESLTDDEKLTYIISAPGVYSTDGSIFTHPYGNNGYMMTAWNYMNFLTQSNKMTIIQTGVSASYQVFKSKYGSLSLKAGYTFEYIKNKGVDSNIYTGLDISVETKKDSSDNEFKEYSWTKDNINYSTTDVNDLYAILREQENNWISSFYNQLNNYIYLSIEYKY